MTRRRLGLLAMTLTGFAVIVAFAERSNGRPHLAMASVSVTLVIVAAVAANRVERLFARSGGEALVFAYWVGVGVRGLVTLVGAMLLGRFGFEPQDRRALVLWVLAAYLTALVFETVLAVRTADRQRLAKSGRAGGANG